MDPRVAFCIAVLALTLAPATGRALTGTAPGPSPEYMGIVPLLEELPQYSCFLRILNVVEPFAVVNTFAAGPINQTWLVPTNEACQLGMYQLALNAGVTDAKDTYSNWLNLTSNAPHYAPGSGVPNTAAQQAAYNLSLSIFTAHQMIISIDFLENTAIPSCFNPNVTATAIPTPCGGLDGMPDNNVIFVGQPNITSEGIQEASPEGEPGTDYIYFVDGLMAAGIPQGTMGLIADYQP
ncbi:hypothetical protein WJX73_007947 [Symbiochloris irregularis]|uniref:Uncharacterized protein n=1 Tax=Symbiochloris irregularis TaxID=706552 RepID=A0AAW1PB54_9CHLO